MGNQSAKIITQTYTKTYRQIQKQDHPFLGTITHLIHISNNSKHILKIFKFATLQQLNQGLKKANKRKLLSQKKGSLNILKTTQINTEKQDQLCGITNYLYLIYQDYNTSLGDMIRLRGEQKNQFGEDQILEMIRGVCNGLVFLNDNGYKNYAVTKESIVKGLSNQNNISSYKLFDTELARQMLPYLKLLNNMGIEKGIYLAPQALQQLANKNTQPDFSLKSDIFSLGMVVLEMCTLQPLDHVYDYNRLKINNYQITQKIKSLKNYSPYLKSLLFQMLQNNQQERIGAISLKQKISLNQAKSTTQYTYSAIGNSNITQRTHKISYPINSVRDHSLLVLNPLSVDQRMKIIQPQPQKKFQRILTFDQLKNQNGYSQNQVQVFDRFSNKSFQGVQKNQLIEGYDINNMQKNKSVQKPRGPSTNIQLEEHRRVIINPNQNPHFYYPNNNIKPMPFKLQPNYTIPNNQQILKPIGQILPSSIKNSNQDLYPIPVQPQSFRPITLKSAIKLSELSMPEYIQEKSQPQTPINNLCDSNTFINYQNISIKAKSFQQSQNNIFNSLNVQFKKVQGNNIQLQNNSINYQYESPNRPPKIEIYTSNYSTPIRKVQALQSVARNSFNNIIKETQQENQYQSTQIQKKQIFEQKNIYLAPKTYGKHHFTNGAIYQGQFDTTGNFCGNGVLYYSNGKICYSGGWINNSFHGFGVLHNQHAIEKVDSFQPTNYENFSLNNPKAWHHYEGEFSIDKKNGFGTLYMCNGEKFSGCFNKDMIEGYGTFTKINGQKISGIWNQNILRKL